MSIAPAPASSGETRVMGSMRTGLRRAALRLTRHALVAVLIPGLTLVGATAAPGLASMEFETSPTPSVAVAGDGETRVGATVRAVPGVWLPQPETFEYQWMRSGQPIAGATRLAYTLTGDDQGSDLTVRITAKKTGYTDTARFSQVRQVQAHDPMLQGFDVAPAPTIASLGGGAVRVGSAAVVAGSLSNVLFCAIDTMRPVGTSTETAAAPRRKRFSLAGAHSLTMP